MNTDTSKFALMSYIYYLWHVWLWGEGWTIKSSAGRDSCNQVCLAQLGSMKTLQESVELVGSSSPPHLLLNVAVTTQRSTLERTYTTKPPNTVSKSRQVYCTNLPNPFIAFLKAFASLSASKLGEAQTVPCPWEYIKQDGINGKRAPRELFRKTNIE